MTLFSNKNRVILDLGVFPRTGESKYFYHSTVDGFFYYWNEVTNTYTKLDNALDVLTTVQPTPLATGNTTNLNTVFKDANNDTWIVDSQGDAVKFGAETVTNVEVITDGFKYTNESGNVVNVTQKLDSTDPLNQKIQTFVDGTKVFEFPLYTVNNDIQINNAGSEWDLTDDQITILETNGDSQTINFPYRVTVVVNGDGSISIKQNGLTVGTIPAPIADVAYSKMLFVDPINGLDTNTGSDNRMFQTLTKALTVADGSGYRIVLAAGTYTGNFTVTQANIDIVTVAGTDRGNTFINGTLTFAHATSSSSVQGISINNLVHSGAGSLYVSDCQTNTSFSKTSNGYLEVLDSDFTGVSITGAGQSVFIGGKQAGLTVNNAGAIVTVKDSNNLAVTTVTAGTLGVLSSIGFAATANGKAITASAGTTVLLSNSQFYGSTGFITSLTLSGSYGIDDVQFDKVNSTLGTNLSTTGWFDKVGIINPATITTATKALVRDANGIVSEQLFPSGLPSGGTDNQVLTVQPDGSYAWEDIPPTANATEWYITGTTIDAGSDKTGNIYRTGLVGVKQSVPIHEVDVVGIVRVLNATTANQFRIDPMDAAGAKLKLGTSTDPVAYWEMGAYNSINNFDNKARDFKIFNTGNTNAFFVKSVTGFVGINNITPSAPLVVQGTTGTGALKLIAPSVAAGDNWWVGFGHGTTSTDANDRARIGVDIIGGGAGRLFFTTGSTGAQIRAMFIDESQRVGIGTNAPAYKLDVNGTARIVTVPTITTATKFLVKDPTTGQISEQSIAGTTGVNVYFNGTDPATGTIFDENNPPTVNNNALKNNDNNTYYGTDGSVWTWNGSAYVTKVYNFPIHYRNGFTATAGQTTWTLSLVPIGGNDKVFVTRNGIDITWAFSVVGNIVTYNPTANGGKTIDTGDRILIHYEAY